MTVTTAVTGNGESDQTSRGRAPKPFGGPRWHLATVACLALVALWALTLRPAAFGGPAEFVTVAGHSMEPALHTGDLVVTRHADRYARGDVIAYPVPHGEPGAGLLVIHRIVGGNGRTGYVTRGDNRDAADVWRPRAHEFRGRLWVHVPGAGRTLGVFRAPLPAAMVAAALTVILLPARRAQR
jgi:signal peptidase